MGIERSAGRGAFRAGTDQLRCSHNGVERETRDVGMEDDLGNVSRGRDEEVQAVLEVVPEA